MDAAREVCARLRQWSTAVVPDLRAVVRESLEQSCALLLSDRAVLAWEEGDEPWLFIASLSGGQVSWSEEDSGQYSPLVDPGLNDLPFATDQQGRLLPSAIFDSAMASTSPIHRHFRTEFELGAVVSFPASGGTIQARVFLVDPQRSDDDALVLAQAAGLLVATRMEFALSAQTLSAEAIAGERIRVARDLHDGLLQSFTGVVLQLETIHSILDSDPDSARGMITAVQGVIMSDQRELRSYVENLRPRVRQEMAFDFAARLAELRARFESQWKIRIHVNVDNIDPLVSQALGHETFRLIHEAVTNAAKHGAATEVWVHLRTDESRMQIDVNDNGSGFPFHGRRTLEEIRRSGGGPGMLADRVASLNGELAVESSDTGARIEITVPLGFTGG